MTYLVEQWQGQEEGGTGLPKVDTYHTDQKAANMETSGVVALLFQSCRAFADIGFREKAQLMCLSEKLF